VADTDWPQILALYTLLRQLGDNPMVMLNYAIAAAMVHGPRHGLALLIELDLDTRLAGHHRLDAVRAHLWEMAHDDQAALAHYRAAAAGTASVPERNYLIERAARLVAKRS
jgi:predicted RNA polymerase sigma factor